MAISLGDGTIAMFGLLPSVNPSRTMASAVAADDRDVPGNLRSCLELDKLKSDLWSWD